VYRKKSILLLTAAFFVISACNFSSFGGINLEAPPTANAGGQSPTTSQPAVTAPTIQPPGGRPAVTLPSSASNGPTLTPPPNAAPSGSSASDKTEPTLSNINTSTTEAYYHDNGCGPTTVTISADATDDSGQVSQVWVDYQYISMSSGVGGNQWFRVNLQDYGNNYYEGSIDLTQDADGELQGNDGTLQYQVYAMDAAGNTRVVPDGFIYGVTALPCFPQAQPPGGGSSNALSISNVVATPSDVVYYGNCTTENTNLNIQATIDPLSEIASATIYYAYASNGTFGNYSTAMFQLGIGDYAGDINVGGEAEYAMSMLGTDSGTVDAYIHVEGFNGDTVDSNLISVAVLPCGGTVGQPPQPPASSIAKGNGTLYNNFSLDLGDGDGDDVIFSQTSSDGSQLLSVWGTELKVDLQADIEACKTSIDTGNTFGAVSINPQDIVCYKTGSGNYGYLVINGFFLDLNDPSQSYVDISYETEVMP